MISDESKEQLNSGQMSQDEILAWWTSVQLKRPRISWSYKQKQQELELLESYIDFNNVDSFIKFPNPFVRMAVALLSENTNLIIFELAYDEDEAVQAAAITRLNPEEAVLRWGTEKSEWLRNIAKRTALQVEEKQ
jgi:hypothetical protein